MSAPAMMPLGLKVNGGKNHKAKIDPYGDPVGEYQQAQKQAGYDHGGDCSSVVGGVLYPEPQEEHGT